MTRSLVRTWTGAGLCAPCHWPFTSMTERPAGKRGVTSWSRKSCHWASELVRRCVAVGREAEVEFGVDPIRGLRRMRRITLQGSFRPCRRLCPRGDRVGQADEQNCAADCDRKLMSAARHAGFPFIRMSLHCADGRGFGTQKRMPKGHPLLCWVLGRCQAFMLTDSWALSALASRPVGRPCCAGAEAMKSRASE